MSTRGACAPQLNKREIRIDFFGYFRFESILQSQDRSKRDHRSVISAEPRLSSLEFETCAFACLAQLPTQFFVATHAAAYRDKIDIMPFCRGDGLANENIDNRRLNRRAKIIQQLVIPSGCEGSLILPTVTLVN